MSRPSYPHIERTLAAMADMRFLISDHQRAELRQRQPLRHLAAQHAALGFRAELPLAGDDEHESKAVVVGTLQEAEQRAMRTALRHAMQIDAGVDLLLAA